MSTMMDSASWQGLANKLMRQEQQLIQQIDRVEAYRQILIATLEQLPEGTRIDIKGRDLLKILADDI